MLRYSVPLPVLELRNELLERAAERNARYIVVLRHTIAKLHLTAADHPHADRWTVCPHADCRRVADLLHPAPVPGHAV